MLQIIDVCVMNNLFYGRKIFDFILDHDHGKI